MSQTQPTGVESPMWTLNWTRIGATEGGNVRDQQSADAYSYVLIPQKWENPNKCRNALGMVGGSEVSHTKGNLIDVESDLRGITRPNSKCNAKQYVPSCPLGGQECPPSPANIVFKDKTTGEVRNTDTSLRHLPTCQTWSYPGTPVPRPYGQETCEISRF
jgi:hypothetical protein|uniref:Uncharacterized protein n=1 Tax=viral metagenome TaxID=1070528 RepID=A0A6C0KXQ6_9ZZZZ